MRRGRDGLVGDVLARSGAMQQDHGMRRRELLGSLAAAFLTAQQRRCEPTDEIRMSVRVREPGKPLLAPGRHSAGDAGPRPPWLHIPPVVTSGAPAPLLILLHGAGQSADLFASAPEHTNAHGIVVLVPNSIGPTWDGIGGRFGRDVSRLENLLEWTIDRVLIDPARICIGGFSDGASYALGLGLANGDLFTHVLAFSPGFIPSSAREGRPALFITHGTRDAILPIDRTSRRLVPVLEQAGYATEYHEFDGPHAMPSALVDQGLAWFARGR
jgi:predicted esterase